MRAWLSQPGGLAAFGEGMSSQFASGCFCVLLGSGDFTLEGGVDELLQVILVGYALLLRQGSSMFQVDSFRDNSVLHQQSTLHDRAASGGTVEDCAM